MFYETLIEQCDKVTILSKSNSINLHKKWLKVFSTNVKAVTGKWINDEHLWEGFSSGLQTSYLNNKALEQYKLQKSHSFYIFDESGKHGFICTSNKLPEFYNTGYDIYLFSEDESWTIVFCHDNVIYFSYANEQIY